MLNYLQNGRFSFILTVLLVHTTTPTISIKKCSFFSVNFHLPIPPILVRKIILTIPTKTLFLYTSAIFHLPTFGYNHPNNQHQKYFPYLSCQLRLRQGTREPGNLVRTDTVLISIFFLKIWTMITEPRITDSLSLSLTKLVYCR